MKEMKKIKNKQYKGVTNFKLHLSQQQHKV